MAGSLVATAPLGLHFVKPVLQSARASRTPLQEIVCAKEKSRRTRKNRADIFADESRITQDAKDTIVVFVGCNAEEGGHWRLQGSGECEEGKGKRRACTPRVSSKQVWIGTSAWPNSFSDAAAAGCIYRLANGHFDTRSPA